MYGMNFKRELNQTASRIAVAVTMSVAVPLAISSAAFAQQYNTSTNPVPGPTASQTCVTAVVTDTTTNAISGYDAGAAVDTTQPFSLACGGYAAANGSETVSVGFGSNVWPNGTDYDPANGAASSSANQATAVGVKSYTRENLGSAFGYQAKTMGIGGVAIGANAVAGDGQDNASASGGGAVAVGNNAAAKENQSIAIGQGATVSAVTGTALHGIAIGAGATVQKDHGIAIGKDATAAFQNSIAIGRDAVTSVDHQIVLGGDTATYRLPGIKAPDSKTYAVTVDQEGDLARVELPEAQTGLKISGPTANSKANAATVSTNINAIALGSGATVTGANGIAIGANVSAGVNEVVIGNADTTKYKLSGLKTGAASTSTYFVTVDSTGELGWATVSGGGGGSEPGIELTGTTAGGPASNAVVGSFSNASAIGSAAQAGANNATAVGAGAKANFAGAVAVGQGSEVTGIDGIAFGRGSTAGAGGIAIGPGATAAANQTVIGGSTYQLSGLKANTGSASTSGYVVTVDTNGNLGWAAAGGGGGSEPGLKLSGATANSAANPASVGAFTNAVALGSGAQVTGAGGIAIGAGVSAGAGETVIGGTKYRLSGLGAPANGSQYFVTVDSTGQLGFSTVSGGGTGGDPLGWKATGTNGGAATASTITSGKADALALGSGASATGDNAVALGAKSVAGAANSGMSYTVAGQTLTNLKAANGVVSVSGPGIDRQITGVADGAVSANSTDAINGSQLFKVGNALDSRIGALDTKVSKVGSTLGSGILGTTVTMAPDGSLSTSDFTVGSATYGTVQEAFDGINTSIQNISNGGSVGVSLKDANGGTNLAPASTSGKFASAVGSGATATGDNTTALGGGSKATAAGATAVGATAQATHAGSTAIGSGATSERANQMVYGTASNTHTMKGTTSAASQALVDKQDSYIMVTNANGDIAGYKASDLNLASQSDLTNIRNEVNSVRHDVNRAFKQIDENTQGIAIAIAMTGALTLPVNHNFGISANWGNYEGKNAFSSTAAFRLSEHLIASGALGVGLDTGSVGTRVGVQMTW